MSLLKIIVKLCSKVSWLKKCGLAVYGLYKKCDYRWGYQKKETINEKMVIFESYMGRQYACSPKALYEAMKDNPEYESWTKVWAFREPEKYRFLEKNKNTLVIKRRGRAYYKYFAQAKYWITNSRLPKELQPLKKQVYVQCWHGTPLKKLGYDLEHYGEKQSSLKEVRQHYLDETKRVTHMPSPSPFYTEKISSAFHLKEMGKADVIMEMGYPRNDYLFTTTSREVDQLKEKLGIPADKKVILYAPTWRETGYTANGEYQYQLNVHFEKWQQALGDKYVVLFRTHYFISNTFDFGKYKGFVYNVSDWDDINELYVMSDLLITDYSSVFFDYANLERPMLFYMYDYDEYKNVMRDFYFDVNELPGPIIKKEEELLEKIKDIDNIVMAYKKSYESFNKKFNPHRQVCSTVYLNKWLMKE